MDRSRLPSKGRVGEVMQNLLDKTIASFTRLKLAIDPRYVRATFAGHSLWLDQRWRHERNYLAYLNGGGITGPLAMDIWVFSHFVKQGHRVLDAGANIGFTSLLAEKSGASEVHCFEPDPRLLERLKLHCRGDKIVVHSEALGERQSVLQLRLSTVHNQGSTLNERIIQKFPGVFTKPESVQVNVNSVDNLFGTAHFDFFKIDVEGAEVAVLRGASSALRTNPPSYIYIEIYDEFFDEVNEFLRGHYRFAYRIICDRNGSGRLIDLQEDVSQMEAEGYDVMPPSYIYSLSAHDDLAACWTQPFASREPARTS